MDDPIFIVGAPRSGTTLTAKILGRHSRVFMPGETHFFEDIYSRRAEFNDHENFSASVGKIIDRLKDLYGRYNEPEDQKRLMCLFEDRKIQLEKRLKSCSSYKEILSVFMGVQAEELGKARWGNNTPKDLFYIEDILHFYPNAKIITCIRDARDFLLSYKYRWRTTAVEEMPRIKSLYHPILTTLLWKASVKKILRIKKIAPRESLMAIHYEDLVANPNQIINEICSFIGEKFEPRMLSIQHNNSSTENNFNSIGIFTSSIGRWRSELSHEEAWIAQYIAAKELEDTGYLREELDISYIKLIGIFLCFPFSLIKAIYANEHKRGPLLPYLFRRIRLLVH